MKLDKSSQQGVRSDLARIVETHFRSEWQRPIGAHSVAAFDAVRDQVQASSAPLIIDSCCGTGQSTRYLAGKFSDALVLGVDKSAHRLARHQDGEAQNYIMLRADVNDFGGWPWMRAGGRSDTICCIPILILKQLRSANVGMPRLHFRP